MKIEDIIKRPLILTEKGTVLRESQNQYLFEVHPKANKAQIRNAVESLFRVNVRGVNTLIVRGKPKRLGRVTIKTRNWKKAMVTVAPGESIEVFDGGAL